jgi:redox-sensitive bicupin YhaK (pirin superfamily)
MSRHESPDPVATRRDDDVALHLRGIDRPAGTLPGRRLLPGPECRSVGPFVLLDEIGPTGSASGEEYPVPARARAATLCLTRMHEGTLCRRDGPGRDRLLQPGTLERLAPGPDPTHPGDPPADLQGTGEPLHGFQVWLAMPDSSVATQAACAWHDRLPVFEEDGVRCTLIAGGAFGLASPVAVPEGTVLLEMELETDARTGLPRAAERALYLMSGTIRTGSCVLEAGEMAVLRADRMPLIRALRPSRFLLLGGKPVTRNST